MMRPRIIPVLQIHRGWLTKTKQFRGNPYLGDPVNAVRIFNELEVDELVIIDVSASRGETPVDPSLIASIASEAFMPVAYGGGIASPDQAKSLVRSGVEKLIFSSALSSNPDLLSEVANAIGVQSVVASIDVDRRATQAPTRSHRACPASVDDSVALALHATQLGAGEIVVNSVDRDGTRQGYDLDVISAVADAVDVPVLALGGAEGACAGSLFVYYGRHDAVLVTYPTQEALNALLSK